MGKSIAYGGVIFDARGRVLLRKPKNEYDGYVWTFPKGRPNAGETPEQAALREAREESGFDVEIVAPIPQSFEGGTTVNTYYLMRPIGETPDGLDKETEAVHWAEPEEAREFIGMTRNQAGRKRDLAVLAAAMESRG